mmetsp:Transcript_42401/g.68695  ORF Transcript_42401/g.68695 Transcript_42401/m.68695 type:complete len:256 (-) Transcript_42401:1115-1882(-)
MLHKGYHGRMAQWVGRRVAGEAVPPHSKPGTTFRTMPCTSGGRDCSPPRHWGALPTTLCRFCTKYARSSWMSAQGSSSALDAHCNGQNAFMYPCSWSFNCSTVTTCLFAYLSFSSSFSSPNSSILSSAKTAWGQSSKKASCSIALDSVRSFVSATLHIFLGIFPDTFCTSRSHTFRNTCFHSPPPACTLSTVCINVSAPSLITNNEKKMVKHFTNLTVRDDMRRVNRILRMVFSTSARCSRGKYPTIALSRPKPS